MECPFSAHKKIRSKRRCFTEFITARSNECMHASEWMNDSATLWWPECLVHWLNQWMTEWMTICIEGVNHRTNNINNKSFLTYYFSEPRLLSASYSLSYLVSEQPLLWALSYLFSKSPRVWATSCLSCFFSDQPLPWLLLLWAISALSKVFSATSSLSNPFCGLFLSWVISSYNYLFLELLILWAKPSLTYFFSELPLLCGTSSLSRVFSEPSFLWATSLSQVVPKPLLLSLIRSPAIYGLQNSVGICDIMCEAHLTLIPQCAVLVHYISFTCDLIWIVLFLAFCTVSFWALVIPVMPDAHWGNHRRNGRKRMRNAGAAIRLQTLWDLDRLTDLGCFWFAWGQQLMAIPLHIAPHSESLGTCVSKTFRQREDQRRAGNKKPSVVPENLCETNRKVVKTPGTKLSQRRYMEILLVDVARFVEFLEFSLLAWSRKVFIPGVCSQNLI